MEESVSGREIIYKNPDLVQPTENPDPKETPSKNPWQILSGIYSIKNMTKNEKGYCAKV